jgi:hypothetical protein
MRMKWHRSSLNRELGNGRGSWAWLLAALSFGLGTWLGRDIASVPGAPTKQLPEHTQPRPKPLQRGHETRDANVKWLFGIVFFLLFSGLIIHGILASVLSLLKGRVSPADLWEPVARPRSLTQPAGPQLQISPPMDLQKFRAREENQLNSYGWVNRTAGVVRIPISRAMELVLQEGLPVGTNRVGPSSDQLMLQRPNQRETEVGRGK